MSVEHAISLKDISKVFKRYKRPADRLKEMILPGKSYAQEFWALRDISLDIPFGETLGILGRNGAGKSTLLKIITGTLQPTSGEIYVNGRVSALLELGSGFNPEFTGRQNVFFNGRLLGLSQIEIEKRFDDIVAFADIGDFLEQPVKTYSSGMRARLAFAVASSIEPDILIVDEVLAVGDGIFVHKCMRRIEKIIDCGKCVLFVSHNTAYINSLCSKCLWLDHGKLQQFGTASEVSKAYQAFMADSNSKVPKVETKQKTSISAPKNDSNFQQVDSSINLSGLEASKPSKRTNTNSFTQEEYLSPEKYDRFGTGRCEILNVRLTDASDKDIGFIMPGEVLKIVIQAIAHDTLLQPIFGVTMFNRLRVPICGWNSQQYNYELGNLSKGEILEFEIHLEWPSIAADIYAFETAVAELLPDNTETLDWIQTPKTIKSGCQQKIFGLMRMHENKVAMTHKLSH